MKVKLEIVFIILAVVFFIHWWIDFYTPYLCASALFGCLYKITTVSLKNIKL